MNKSISLPLKNILLLSLIVFLSCDMKIPEKDDFASWTTKIEVPMLEKIVTFEDIIEDSLINPMDSLYTFTKEVEVDTVEVGDQLEIEDIQESFTQNVDDVTVEDSQVQERIGFDEVGVSPLNELIKSEIGTISLSPIPEDSTDGYTFSSIFPNFDDLTYENHDIDPFDLDPVENSFSFNDFSHAEFSSGELMLTIFNNLVIPLGDIEITLKRAYDGADIDDAKVTISDIPIGARRSGTIDLEGKTLPGDIIVGVSGDSPGKDNVEINNSAGNSYFKVYISGSELKVSSATAKIPPQEIEETDHAIELSAEDSNKVDLAVILNGNLVISVDNNMQVGSTVRMDIPTIRTPTGNPFQAILSIPSSLDNETVINREFDLNEHSLDMDLNDQSVKYDYWVNTLDTEDNLVTIHYTDDIEISISIYGETPDDEITFSHFTGKVAPQNLGFDGTIDIESESEILEANLSTGLLEIVVENNVNDDPEGAPTALIRIPELIKKASGETLSILLENMSGSLNQPIDLSDYNILMTLENQQLSYTADVTTDYDVTTDEVGSYSLNDSIFIDIKVSGISFNEVRGYFSQDAMVDANSIAIDDDTKIETSEVKSGELLLDIENNIGILAEVEFIINEFTKNGLTLDTTISLPPSGGSYIIDLSDYQLNLNKEDDPQTVNYVSTISLPDSIEMTLSLNESISVNVNLSNLTFESVTGDIKQMTVEIDTVIQKIDGLPEEIEDFAFTAVNMFIEFDTDIGAPENSIDVILDLEITALSSTDSITSEITGWNIIDSSRVIIPDAEALINIFPDTIRASGSATVSGSGSVTNTQFVSGIMTVEAPLSFIISDSTEIDIDIEETDLELDDKILKEVVVFFDVENHFDFGTEIAVYASSDSLLFGTSDEDTLFTSTFTPNAAYTDSIILDPEKIGLFRGDKLYIKADVFVSGNKNENGNSIPSIVLTTDSLNLMIYGRIEVLVDPTEED